MEMSFDYIRSHLISEFYFKNQIIIRYLQISDINLIDIQVQFTIVSFNKIGFDYLVKTID